MIKILRATTHTIPVAFPALALPLVALAIGGTGCEDQAIGRPCDLQADAGVLQATVNGQALECPTRICMKPAQEISAIVTTVPYCTAECKNDGDCEGETRQGKNPRDQRCNRGFICGIATVTGTFKCRKLCICKDFIDEKAGVPKPAACE